MILPLCVCVYVCVCVCYFLSHVPLFVSPWTVASQAPLSMEIPRQEYWSGLPFPTPGDLPDTGIEPKSPALQILHHLSHQQILNPIYMIFNPFITNFFLPAILQQ